MNLTLLDSTAQKIQHLKSYCQERGYDNIKFVSARVEKFARENSGTYDYAYARAVSHLRVLIEIIMPLLKVGGTLIALKGRGYEDEIMQSKDLLNKVGCKIDHIYEDVLPISEEKRYLIYIKKTKPTPDKFPRDYAIIKKEVEKSKK